MKKNAKSCVLRAGAAMLLLSFPIACSDSDAQTGAGNNGVPPFGEIIQKTGADLFACHGYLVHDIIRKRTGNHPGR